MVEIRNNNWFFIIKNYYLLFFKIRNKCYNNLIKHLRSDYEKNNINSIYWIVY